MARIPTETGAKRRGHPDAASNQAPVLGAVTFLLAGGTVALVRRPASRSAWAVVATIVLVIAWLEAPTVGNHWLLLGVFAAAVLASLWRRTPWPWLAGTVRVTFLAFYAFAAFAKLNTAFLDPAVSCAVFYADQALTSWGLAPLTPESPLAAVPVVVALVVELSVPVLLIVRRTRGIGVALAAVFHYAISLDLLQHFYDFTSVIFVGLGAWAHEDVTTPITRWLRHRRAVTWVTITWAVLAAAVIAVRWGLRAAWSVPSRQGTPRKRAHGRPTTATSGRTRWRASRPRASSAWRSACSSPSRTRTTSRTCKRSRTRAST